METDLSERIAHPLGEQPEVEEWSTVADTFAGRVHIVWDTATPVTPLGQLPFLIEYLKQGGLFDGWVADCPCCSPARTHTSPGHPVFRGSARPRSRGSCHVRAPPKFGRSSKHAHPYSPAARRRADK